MCSRTCAPRAAPPPTSGRPTSPSSARTAQEARRRLPFGPRHARRHGGCGLLGRGRLAPRHRSVRRGRCRPRLLVPGARRTDRRRPVLPERRRLRRCVVSRSALAVGHGRRSVRAGLPRSRLRDGERFARRRPRVLSGSRCACRTWATAALLAVPLLVPGRRAAGSTFRARHCSRSPPGATEASSIRPTETC